MIALVMAAALAAETAPPSYEDLHRRAREAARSGDRAGAIALYGEILEGHPDDADALLGRGRVLGWEKRWAEAESDLLRAAGRSPGYADVWRALGDVYLWSDRHDSAAWAYRRWGDLRPDDTEPAEALERVNRSRPRPWELSVSYDFVNFSPPRSGWYEATTRLSRDFDSWSIAVVGAQVRRFGREDQWLAADAYADLWRRAYVNLYVQSSFDFDISPRLVYMAEVFQGVGLTADDAPSLLRSWEVSGSYRNLRFRGNSVDIYGASVGKYQGAWYARMRGTWVPGTLGTSESYQGLLRWYFAGNADDHVEAEYGWGTKPDEIRTQTDLVTVQTTTMRLGVEKWLNPSWGVSAGWSYRDERRSFVHRSATFGIAHRW